MKLFAKPASMLDEVLQMQKDEQFRREDRAQVGNFFNGQPPLTQEEAEELGFTINVNHLFGYTQLNEAAEQIMSGYNKPSGLVEIELDAAPPGKRMDWSMKASAAASRVLRGIKKFKSAYQGASGDAAMHGEALFFHSNTTFPLPKHCPLSRMLIPRGASTDVQELTHYGIECPFGIAELTRYFKNPGKHWKKDNLGKILKGIYQDNLKEGRMLTPDNVEELEYERQENSATERGRRVGVNTVYFYQLRADKPGMPYDLSIMLAPNDETCSSVTDKAIKEGSILYEGPCVIPRVKDSIHPMFMDCIIGGAPKWHRVLGQGALNYQLNHSIELMVNRAQQATWEGAMNLWVANNATSREAMEQILLRHNGIIPEGMSMVHERFEPNFSGLLEMIQFFRQQGARNSRGSTPNNGDPNDMLEVQALAEMNAGASASSNRSANWYDYMDGVYEEAIARLCNPFIEPHECGYSEVMDFQNEMARLGVPLEYLERGNIRVRAVRIIGDGVRAKELGIVNYLTTNRGQYAPEVQPKITRLCTGLALDNQRLAEELTPLAEEPDSPQQMRAESENAIMITSRRPQQPKVDDVDETHVVNHFPALETLITDALQYNNGAFLPQMAQAFQVIGAHILMHVARIEEKAQNNRSDPARESARAFRDQLNQFAAMGEKLVNNMEQQQGGQNAEMDPVEMAKLQLQAEQLTLAREKLAFSQAKFERTQGNREQNEAFKQLMDMERNRREDQQSRTQQIQASREASRKDVETAVKVTQANQPPTKAKP